MFKMGCLLYSAKPNYAPRLEAGNALAAEETGPQHTHSQGGGKGKASIALSEQTLHSLILGVDAVT